MTIGAASRSVMQRQKCFELLPKASRFFFYTCAPIDAPAPWRRSCGRAGSGRSTSRAGSAGCGVSASRVSQIQPSRHGSLGSTSQA